MPGRITSRPARTASRTTSGRKPRSRKGKGSLLPSVRTLEGAFAREIADLLHAERQMAKAIPMLLNMTADKELRKTLERHLTATEHQIMRLEQVQQRRFGGRSRPCPSQAMAGIIAEARDMCAAAIEPAVRDALVIAAVRTAAHFEIASYDTATAWAHRLGFDRAERLLGDTLAEEQLFDGHLIRLAERHAEAETMH